MDDDIRKEWTSKIPLRRGGTVEDVANTAVYLGSELSSYVTGQVIQVDGGMNYVKFLPLPPNSNAERVGRENLVRFYKFFTYLTSG